MSRSMIFDRSIELVSALKHNRAFRAIMVPPMTVQYARRDHSYARSADSAYMKSLRHSHKGERCFIVGNGPSLTASDLDSLANEITFASNGIFGLFDETVWRPTYYLSVDREFIAHEAQNMPSLPVGHVFVNLTPYSKSLQGLPNVTLLNKRPGYCSSKKYTIDNIVWSDRPDLFVAEGYTVTYTAFQMALYMGFSEIYLIGMDHTYSHVADSSGNVTHSDGIKDHCYNDKKGTHVNPQFREGVEFSYRVARIAAEQQGSHIYNATRGGALEIFERVDLDEVLKAIKGESNE